MTHKWFWDPLCIARTWHYILILEARFIFIWSHFGPQKKKIISKFQYLQCKRVCNPWVSNTLTDYLEGRLLSPLGFLPWILFLSVLWWKGRLLILLPLYIVPLPLLLLLFLLLPILFIFTPCRTCISTSKWTGSTASGSTGSSASSLLLITAALGALTFTLKCLNFNMQSLVNTINEFFYSNENNLNTNRNWIPTKPIHQ